MDGEVGKKGLSWCKRLHASIACRCTYRRWTDLKNTGLVLVLDVTLEVGVLKLMSYSPLRTG